jgi:sentrin-specific protease 1
MFQGGGYNYANVKRWSAKIKCKNVFKLGKIVTPVNLHNTHWCCCYVNFETKTIQYYDSMGGAGVRYLEGMKQYLKDEAKKYVNSDEIPADLLDIDSYTLVRCIVRDGQGNVVTPQQNNGNDCGVFTCIFCNLLSVDSPLAFTCMEMPHFRRRITADIINTALPPPP